MKRFISFITEAADSGGIQHIEHPSDRTFDGPEAAKHALETLRGAASGQTPITRKIDDKMSYQVMRDNKGRVGVKYKGGGSQYNFTPEDVDRQHGHKPYLAHPLKLLLEHLPKVLPKREGEWQGGYMSDPSQRTISKGRISHTPNTIEYSVPTDTQEGKKLKNSKVSTVIHSELTGPNREAHPILDNHEFREHPDVHLLSHLVSHEEQHSIDPVTKRQAMAHLDQAEKLMKNHSYDHHSGHEQTLRSYINSTVSSGEKPSVEGYKNHLMQQHQKKIDSVKMQKTKDTKAAERDAALAHVEKNKKAFDKSLKIHGHVQAATNLLARGLGKSAHGGYGHAIDGKPTGPEGFVAGGLKIVDRGEGGFSAANRARSAILKASRTLGKKV
jgi:Family of unknown function (DUF6267)